MSKIARRKAYHTNDPGFKTWAVNSLPLLRTAPSVGAPNSIVCAAVRTANEITGSKFFMLGRLSQRETE